MAEIFESAGITIAYGVVGFIVMAAGFAALDLVTPRKLVEVVWKERNKGASIVLSGQMLGVGLVISQAIRSSEFQEGLIWGLTSTLVYGLAGVLVMTVVFAVVGIITPGRMGACVMEDVDNRPHPAAWVQGTMYVGTALMVSAALS